MNNILSPKYIEDCTRLIKCGEDCQGSGFLISQNKVLTAYHVVEDSILEGEQIVIGDDIYSSDSILAKSEKLDLCIIQLKEKCSSVLPLLAAPISYKQICSVFGFPYVEERIGAHFEGKVDVIRVDRNWDFSFQCHETIDSDYSGLSGGAIVSYGRVVGVALLQRDKSIAAISIEKASTFLQDNDILISKEVSANELPEQLKEDVESSTPNYSVFEKLTEILEVKNGWMLSYGSPGSGKTTFVASYNSTDEKIKVCGRYFTKIPQDKTPLSVRISEKSLLTWLEKVVEENTGINIEVLDKYEDRINRIPELLRQLSIGNNGSNSVLFIDGLDEISDLGKFLSIFPSELPKNISLVLSCTSKDILPTWVKTLIDKDCQFEVTPIDLGQCESYIQKKIKIKGLSIETIQKVALKSEGHPLYLRYLINNLNSLQVSNEEISEWITNVPTIGGEISKYYDSLWDGIYRSEEKLWIILVLSQIRQPISEEVLIEMLPESLQIGFYSNFTPIAYLFKGDNQLELYHASFKHYISSRVNHLIPMVNDLISGYCKQNKKSLYAVENTLFHVSLGKNSNQSIEICDQTWADECAFNHVNPDLIIEDVKSVINIALRENETTELIRLLLLLQRIEFRYDSVFAENTESLASALISIGDYKSAIKYLVRDNTILVNNHDAVLFLMRFYESGATEEALVLEEAIERKFRQLITEGFDSNEAIAYDVFFMQFNSLTLSMNIDPHDGIKNFLNFFKIIERQKNEFKKEGLEELVTAFEYICEYCGSWNNAYSVRRFSGYMSSKEVKEKGVKLDSKWSRRIALTAILYNEFNTYDSERFETDETYQILIEDIEWLVEEYGYDESDSTCKILVQALIDDSDNVKLLDKLITKILLKKSDSIDLRDENGVDLNYKILHSSYFENKCSGFKDGLETYLEIPNYSNRIYNWELYFAEILKKIAWLEGGLIRKLKQSQQIEEYMPKLQAILAGLNFKLKERAYWERSYHLPESILPYIYEKITYIYLNFFPDLVDKFIEEVKNRWNFQFGLYSEGFRKSLCSIIEVMINYGLEKSIIIDFIIVLEKHIIDHVQNRWERTPALLKVVQFYGLLDEVSRAKQTYECMLQTSMGPSWYKESQLQLLNTCLKLKEGLVDSGDNFKRFASLLDYASGEMTFQRYVRYDKESLIGVLVRDGKLSQAIDYIKIETVPNVKTLINNVEECDVDTLSRGEGYVNGARTITIQNGVLQILKNCDQFNPSVRIALCNIFTINDDTFRYIDDFASNIVQALNELDDDSDLNPIYDMIYDVLISEETRDDKRRYINVLKSDLKSCLYDSLKDYLKEKYPAVNLPLKEKNLDATEVDKKDREDAFSYFNNLFESDKKVKIEELIKIGVESFETEKLSIWTNYSSASSLAKRNLKSLFKDDKQVTQSLRSFINNFGVEAWSVVDELLWFLNEILDSNQAKEINDIIYTHFALLIRPKEEVLSKYSNIDEGETTGSDLNEDVIKFIIWLLNHPLSWVRDKAYSSLLYLGTALPELTLSALVKESLLNKAQISCETCARIIKELSAKNEKEVSEFLSRRSDFVKEISKLNHFTIFCLFNEIAKILSNSGNGELLQSLKTKIPEGKNDDCEVILDEAMLEPIEFELAELNRLGVLNGKFCESLIENVKYYCGLNNWEEVEKSDVYLRRSYSENKYYAGRYYDILLYSLNKAIFPRVNVSNLESIYSIINN